MGKIKILDESVSNIIAAGEVVENPTAMLKELLENSLDAESSFISIEVKNGGRTLKISDNGKGMNREDLLLCIERHATSKIDKKEDLFNLSSYGFRGEALASICAVSKVRISSACDGMVGNTITVNGGKVTSLKEMDKMRGTEIEIQDLFFNTPARLKFLRKNATEYANIKDVVMQEAIANSGVGITLIIDGKVAIKTSGNGIENCISEIFGFNILKNLIKIECGYVGNSSLSRSTRDSIFSFVNGRIVKSKVIESAVIDSFYTKLSKGRYPFAIIFIEVDPGDIDVNVHPSKKIVKFADEIEIYERVRNSIDDATGGTDILTAGEFTSTVRIEPAVIEKQPEKKMDIGNFLKSEEIVKKNKLPLKNSINEVLKIRNYVQGEVPRQIQEEEKVSEKKIYSPKIESLKNESINIEKHAEEREISEDMKPLKTAKREFEENQNIEKIRENSQITISSEKKEILSNSKIENTQKNFQSDNEKTDYKIIGQFLDSYIIVEKDSQLELYDQHIVHERILYEELKGEILGKRINSQNLLVPKRLRMDPRDREFIRKNLGYLKEFGFDVDIFDDNEMLIRAVPLFDFRDSLENLFLELIEELKDSKGIDPRERVIISMSCKGAVKAGEKLSLDEMETLIKRLYEIKEFTCPHGRPIIVRLTLDEIEKRFKRK